MTRYLKSFILVVFIYLLLFAGFVLYLKDNSPIKKVKDTQKRVSFTIVKKVEPKPIIKPKSKPKQKLKPIVKPKSKPKKKIVKHIKKKPKILEKKPISKPISKPIISKPQPKLQAKPDIIKTTQKIKPQNKEFIKEDKKELIQAQKQQYYQLIRELINQNKIYPKSARRRGVQGSVKVKFSISKYGDLLSINVLNGKKIFYKSVKKAINNTFPVLPPKGVFKDSFELELKMVYKLR